MESLEKATSMAYNNIMSGLHAMDINAPVTMKEVEDKIIQTRLDIIYEYHMKGLLPKGSLITSLDNITVGCSSMSCDVNDTTTKHIELPPIAVDLGTIAIDYLGSTDKLFKFTVYTTFNGSYRDKYRKTKNKRPYAIIDTTINSNGMHDVYIFNAPFLQQVSARIIIADPRKAEEYTCCGENDKTYESMEVLTDKIVEKAVNSYLTFYRKLTMQKTPNDQSVKNQ